MPLEPPVDLKTHLRFMGMLPGSPGSIAEVTSIKPIRPLRSRDALDAMANMSQRNRENPGLKKAVGVTHAEAFTLVLEAKRLAERGAKR